MSADAASISASSEEGVPPRRRSKSTLSVRSGSQASQKNQTPQPKADPGAERNALIATMALWPEPRRADALRHECLRGNLEQVENLVRAEADVTIPNRSNGATTLMNAARRVDEATLDQRAEIINILVERGADLQAKDEDGLTGTSAV